MYGTRRAATNWQTHYTKVLVQNGFTTGVANNCTFYNPEKDSTIYSRASVRELNFGKSEILALKN